MTRPITRISPASASNIMSMLRASWSPAMRLFSATGQPPRRRREHAAAMLEVVEHVQAGAGRREQHHVAGLREGGGGGHGRVHVLHSTYRHVTRDGALDQRRILAQQ